ncbi:hypothetical protein Adt_14434 [Abeliophyllum distichum]|uniref:Uncharacterized protein n=1 Tax=Abeliophyllum distichum TaxID=126358 RepID=A0ABD1TZL8_9LAMI
MVDSNAPMPWIGVYAAVASLIWVVALTADVVHSVRHRKLWFPCRYSPLNAASLTVLAIAVKLAMDLTTPMPGILDQAAKSRSTAFLCASTTHFMPSIGSMSDRDIVVNLAALGILIVTLTVNVIIQVFTGVIEDWMRFQAVVVFLNVYSFIILSSSALTVFTSKRYLEHKYNELHKRISGEELQGDEIMDLDKLKLRVKKYWVMAETGNPQFVMARSEASAVLFMICLISYLSNGITRPHFSIVIVLVNKLFVPISFFGSLYILVRFAVYDVLVFTIPLTILIYFGISRKRIIRCLVTLKNKFLRESEASVNRNESENMHGYEQDLRKFVLLLESEAIQNAYLMFIDTSINSYIMIGARHQPRYLMDLLENSTSFEGVLKFESDLVSPIIGKEPLNCWSLSVATLTSIIIALPKVQNEKRNKLLRSVIEGFKYVHLIEKSLDVRKELVSSTNAADFLWVVAELRGKWLDTDLQKIARVSKFAKETLQILANKSEDILKEFKRKMNGNMVESGHINLPENVIIANSMYKISNTLLLVYEESYHSASDTQVFEKLSVIIADIFAACLTNLPHVILMKCYS